MRTLGESRVAQNCSSVSRASLVPRVAVVHLVRAANGPAPLAQFLDSLRTHDAGREYDLVYVLKGFPKNELPPEYETLIGTGPHARVFTTDVGFDLGAYFVAAREVAHERLCFFNSFSRILHPDWLRLFDEALNRPDVGIVGATGSAESLRGAARDTDLLGSTLRLASPRNLYKALAFPPFPNYHIRSNAFFLSRSTFLSLTPASLRSKRDLYRFESGRRSMTRATAGRTRPGGARDRAQLALAYEPSEWARSKRLSQRRAGKPSGCGQPDHGVRPG